MKRAVNDDPWPVPAHRQRRSRSHPSVVPDIDGYVSLRSGFPETVLRLRLASRDAWLDAYLEHVVSWDVLAAGVVRDPVRLRRYLDVLGLSTAGLPAESTLVPGCRYRPAHRRRLRAGPRKPLPAGSAARAATVLRDGDLLGRVLDTFVTAQLRPEIALVQFWARLHHLRSESGRHEMDLVVDLGGGRVVGVEVNASSAPGPKDSRHLVWLRDQLGERFVRGIVGRWWCSRAPTALLVSVSATLLTLVSPSSTMMMVALGRT